MLQRVARGLYGVPGAKTSENEGVERRNIDGVKVPVFNAARTIVDCFRSATRSAPMSRSKRCAMAGSNGSSRSMPCGSCHPWPRGQCDAPLHRSDHVMTANRAASFRARLKQHTDTSKQDFNLTLTRYGLERLLYRLSVSEHAPSFLTVVGGIAEEVDCVGQKRYRSRGPASRHLDDKHEDSDGQGDPQRAPEPRVGRRSWWRTA